MSILSSLKSAYSTVKSKVGGVLNNAANSLVGSSITAADNLISQNTAASQPNSTPIPYGSYPLSASNPSVNQTYIPNMSTASGPAASTPSGTIVYNPGGTINTLGTVSANSSLNGVRPSTAAPAGTTSTWTPPVNEQGQMSSSATGTPYFDASGNYVVPTNNFSGFSGTGGGGVTIAPAGSQGSMGSDLARGYQGVGQGSSGGGFNQPSSDEQKRKQEKGATQIINPAQKGTEMFSTVSPALAAGKPGQIAPPPVPDVVDAGYVQKVSEQVGKLSSYTGADRDQIINKIQSDLKIAYDNLAIQAQKEGPMVEDTPEQKMFLESFGTPEESLAATQAVDNWKAANTNLNELTSQRQLLRRQIQASDEVFTDHINSIKDNPNLPKALARRQVADLLSVNERAMKNIKANLESIEDRIQTEQQNVNLAFQIKQDAQAQQRYAQERMERQVNRYTSNPVLLNGLSPEELNALSQMSGIPTKSLKKMAEDSIKPDTKSETIGSAETGYYNVIRDKNGSVISKTLIQGGNGGGAAKPTQYEAENNEVTAINKLLNSRASDGTPYADANGYFTVEGFKRILANTSLPRSKVIEQFAGNISPWNAKNYGLTPAEIKKLGF